MAPRTVRHESLRFLLLQPSSKSLCPLAEAIAESLETAGHRVIRSRRTHGETYARLLAGLDQHPRPQTHVVESTKRNMPDARAAVHDLFWRSRERDIQALSDAYLASHSATVDGPCTSWQSEQGAALATAAESSPWGG